jgi:hemolysin D
MKHSAPAPAALEFLPAALEVQETPPLRAARLILWTILAAISAALAWSVLAQVNVVAVAPGRIVPSGKSKTIQAVESGRVRAIRVADGQRVRAGDVLIELDSSISEADVDAMRERVTKLEKTLPLVRQRVTGARRLDAQGLIAHTQLLELEEQRIASEQDLAAMREELIKVRERNQWQTLRAPVGGHVQQLAVHTVGAVVTAAQPLMVIVPDGDALEVEAQVLNKDRGFVRSGQGVVVKVDTFPFTRYGALRGLLLDVGEDAVQHETLGLIYNARVQIERATMQIDGREVALVPGMTVSVEVDTGKRRVVDYFLSPLEQHFDESLRER